MGLNLDFLMTSTEALCCFEHQDSAVNILKSSLLYFRPYISQCCVSWGVTEWSSEDPQYPFSLVSSRSMMLLCPLQHHSRRSWGSSYGPPCKRPAPLYSRPERPSIPASPPQALPQTLLSTAKVSVSLFIPVSLSVWVSEFTTRTNPSISVTE